MLESKDEPSEPDDHLDEQEHELLEQRGEPAGGERAEAGGGRDGADDGGERGAPDCAREAPMSSNEEGAPSGGNQFGAFGGVFTPSLLTILGAVMFMRMGSVIGRAGILSALLILGISKLITLLTGLSISAISTNTQVRGGGAYFLISRSLGPEFGASIGLALFFAQALSVPFYILAFTEALVRASSQLVPEFTLIGVIVAVALFALNYVGSSWALRAQYFILAALLASIASFLIGGALGFEIDTLTQNFDPQWTDDPSGPGFWATFALFFPAVTGIMAGVNMSGDLESPQRAIPRGTLWAIGVGGALYAAQIILIGGSTDRIDLLTGGGFPSLLNKALFGAESIVLAGVFAATLSSAVGSMMGAPRILQALARDQIFRTIAPFALGTAKGDEPRRGLWLTLAITLAVLLAAGGSSGALDTVSSVLTMFFLFTYGMTNIAAFVEKLSRNPSFRPRFRFFHWSSALAGGVGCFGAAFLINPFAALIALAIVVALFFVISRRVLLSNFGDARRGFVYERVRAGLRRLSAQAPHPKNWRPTALILSNNPATRATLARYADWIASGSGIVTIGSVVVGDVHAELERRARLIDELGAWLAARDLEAFVEVQISEDFDAGMSGLLQAHSIGPIKPNLLMLGWSGQAERAAAYARSLRLASALAMSVVLVVDRGLPQAERPGRARRIDVWWRGRQNGSLMVILAHMLATNWAWRGATVRLIHLLGPDEDEAAERARALALVERGRVEAEIVMITGESFVEAAARHSHDADVVLFGFRPPEGDEAAERFHDFWSGILPGLPTALLVSSSGEADLTH